MKTYSVKASELNPQWRVLDAEDRALGRLAVEAAKLLKGKHNPLYAPHLNTGDFVVIVNAAKVRLTGRKREQKEYIRHSGYPGGMRVVSFEEMMAKHPTRAVEYAVRGMLPKNRLGEDMFRRLKVYAGPVHPHAAQIKERAQAETQEQAAEEA